MDEKTVLLNRRFDEASNVAKEALTLFETAPCIAEYDIPGPR